MHPRPIVTDAAAASSCSHQSERAVVMHWLQTHEKKLFHSRWRNTSFFSQYESHFSLRPWPCASWRLSQGLATCSGVMKKPKTGQEVPQWAAVDRLGSAERSRRSNCQCPGHFMMDDVFMATDAVSYFLFFFKSIFSRVTLLIKVLGKSREEKNSAHLFFPPLFSFYSPTLQHIHTHCHMISPAPLWAAHRLNLTNQKREGKSTKKRNNNIPQCVTAEHHWWASDPPPP